MENGIRAILKNMSALNTKREIAKQAIAVFERILLRYETQKDLPIATGDGDRLFASQVHTIEAIGKTPGSTVTSLKGHFRVTKGAVAQVVMKLESKGYVRKLKREGNAKENILELTKRGWRAFDLHEKAGERAEKELIGVTNRHTTKELASYLAILTEIDGAMERLMKE